MAKRKKTRRGKRARSAAARSTQRQPPSFTRAYWGRTRAEFPPSAAGLSAWYRKYGRPYQDQVEVVQGGDEPKLRINDTLIDVIAGSPGNPRWGWKSSDETATAANIDEQPQPEDPTAPTGTPPGPFQRDRIDPRTYPGYTTYQRDTSDPRTYPGYTPQGVPPRGGRWDSGAATEDDMYGDPTAGDPVTVEEEAFPGYDPSKRYFWNGIDAWVEMKPDGGPDGDGCYNDHKGDKVCYDSASHPGSRPPDIGSTEVDPNPVTTDDTTTTTTEDSPCPPWQRVARKGKDKGECKDKRPCPAASDGTPQVRSRTTGKCVPDTSGPGGGSGGGGGGGSDPGYKGYGTGPNEPWDVDLGYLRDAPAFDFEHDPWVEPEAFTYAAYDQPDPFSHPEFAPPTGQQLLDEDPGYQFRMDEGRKALERSAAKRGTLRSGATLKGLIDYGQDMGSQEYQQAYNRRLQQYREGAGLAERSYDRNLGAGQWAYGTNLGAAQRQWAANRQAQLEGFQQNRQDAYQLARDRYDPQYRSWDKEQAARERAAFARYGRQGEAWRARMIPAQTIYTVGAGMEPGLAGPTQRSTSSPFSRY